MPPALVVYLEFVGFVASCPFGNARITGCRQHPYSNQPPDVLLYFLLYLRFGFLYSFSCTIALAIYLARNRKAHRQQLKEFRQLEEGLVEEGRIEEERKKMAQIRGTAGYNITGGDRYGGPSRNDTTNDPSPLDAIREQTSRIEDWLDTYSDPIKPFLPAIGRFLIVVTFLEDALRIITQWNDQLLYLNDYRHIPWGLTHIFLLVNVIAMAICSVLVITRKYSDYAVFGLIGVVVTQALGYGLIFDLNFFLRNLSVMGGLLMVLSDSWVRKRFAPPGLPQMDEKDKRMWVQLAGRVLLIFLFIGFVFSGEWGIGRVVVSIFGFVACVMVVVGFKAKLSAVLLVVILCIFNVFVNNFWTLHEHHPHKDFAKYDFFQILSIVGGLVLLVNTGPGQFSVDEKKKVY